MKIIIVILFVVLLLTPLALAQEQTKQTFIGWIFNPIIKLWENWFGNKVVQTNTINESIIKEDKIEFKDNLDGSFDVTAGNRRCLIKVGGEIDGVKMDIKSAKNFKLNIVKVNDKKIYYNFSYVANELSTSTKVDANNFHPVITIENCDSDFIFDFSDAEKEVESKGVVQAWKNDITEVEGVKKVTFSLDSAKEYDLKLSDEILIDPTIQLTSGDDKADIYYGDVTSNGGIQLMFNISSMPSGAVINNATMCLYLVGVAGTISNNARLWKIEDTTWNEASSAVTLDAQVKTNQTDEAFSSFIDGTWACVNITEQLNASYVNGQKNVTIRFEFTDYLVGSIVGTVNVDDLKAGNTVLGGVQFTDRENTDASGKLPYINITYAGGINVNNCSTLNIANTKYQLANNVINNQLTTDCMIISAQNITFDCNGYYIASTQNYSGVYSNQWNTTIKNCNISMGTGNNTNSMGIEMTDTADYSSVLNNTIIGNGMYYGISWDPGSNGPDNSLMENNSVDVSGTVNAIGIYLRGASNNILIGNNGTSNLSIGIYLNSASGNNILTNNTGTSNSDYGIRLNSLNNILTNNTGTSNSSIGIYIYGNNNTLTGNTGTSNSSYGIYLSSASNNTFTSNTGTSNSSYGIYLNLGTNNTLISNIGTSNSSYGIYLRDLDNTILYNTIAIGYLSGSSGIAFRNASNNIIQDCINISGGTTDVYYVTIASTNNTFTNCSYDLSKESVLAGSSLIRKWYYRANATDTSNNPVVANVTATNASGAFEFSIMTNESGLTNITTITEYVNDGGTRSYYSNYTINATNSSYNPLSHFYNVSVSLNNLNDVFTLSYQLDNSYPLFSNNQTSTANNSEYSPNTNYQFNITILNSNGTAGIEFNGVNYSIFNISNSFYYNAGSLKAGTYSYYFWSYGNGSSHNYNISQIYSYNVNVNSSYILSISGTTPINYLTVTDIVGNNCPNQLTCSLNLPNRVYKVGTITFNYSTMGNENYSSNSVTKDIVINKIAPSISINILPSNNVIIGTTTNASGDNCPNQLICQLYKDNLLVSNPDVSFFNIGNYTYIFNTTGNENYTSNSITEILTVSNYTTIQGTIANPKCRYLKLGYYNLNLPFLKERNCNPIKTEGLGYG